MRPLGVAAAVIVAALIGLGCGQADSVTTTAASTTTVSFDYCVDSETGQTVDCSTPGSATPPDTAGPPENCVVKVEPWDDDYCSGVKPDGTPCRPIVPPWYDDTGDCQLLEDLRSEYEAEHGN